MRLLIGVVITGLVAAGVLYSALRSYLHSDAFRRFLSAKAAAAAGVEGGFAPFEWDGLAVESAAFEAAGTGAIRRLRLDELHTEIVLGGLRRGVWELRGSNIRRLEVAIDAHGDTAARPAPVTEPPARRAAGPRRRGWLPSEVELPSLDVHHLSVEAHLKQGSATASGIALHAESAGGPRSWRAELRGGTLQLPFANIPAIRLGSARLRVHDGGVFLTHLDAAAYENARLEASGEWDQPSHNFSIDGRIGGVKCAEILNPDWAKRLLGEIRGQFILGNPAGHPSASGQLAIDQGTLTALPVLDALASYADTSRFRTLTHSEAHSDWRWDREQLEFTRLVLASEGLIRLEGRVSIRGRDLDGQLRLGLAPGTLATIPGAESHVFTPGERGLMWTPLRLTGTLDKPREDLTDRLLAAAGMRMLETLPETGEKVLKFGRSVLSEESTKILEKGVDILQEKQDVIREVHGILDGILGGERGDETKQP